MYRTITVGLLAAMLAVAVQAADLLETTTSWDGGAIAYPEGQARITSFILHARDGQPAPFHCHPVPTMGYVLSGTVLVETVDGRQFTVEQGQSMVEVMKTLHRGQGLNGDADILVFYAGSTELPNTVMMDADNAKDFCLAAP